MITHDDVGVLIEHFPAVHLVPRSVSVWSRTGASLVTGGTALNGL